MILISRCTGLISHTSYLIFEHLAIMFWAAAQTPTQWQMAEGAADPDPIGPVEHVLLLSCVVAYGVRCSIAGGRRERDFLLFPPF
jgi:hypothetical protein